MEALRMLSKTAGGSEYEAEVERLLSCPICLEVYSKPVVILPCQHNLCRKCANDVFQNRGTPMGSGGRFRCPTCRYEVMLDRHGVYGLQRNLLVENIIDMYQSESKKPFRKVEVLMCEEHEEERVNIFCVTCQKPTCSLCKVFGQHQDCTVSPLEKVYKDHKSEISEAIAMLVAGNDRLQVIISKAEDLTAKTEENSKSTQNDISASFDKLYSVLEQRKKAMISRVKAVTQEKTEVLQGMLKKYGDKLEVSSKLVEEALSLLEEPSAPQFLAVSRELINRVTSTARATDVAKPPSDIHNMDMFEIDFSGHIDYLARVNFPGAEIEDEPPPEDGYETTSDQTSVDSDAQRRSSVASVGDVFHARLLLPKGDVTEEVVAAAKITRKDDEDDVDDCKSLTSRSDGSVGRRGSNTSVEDTKGLDQLDAEVKAIAERYLSGRASRQRSHATAKPDLPRSSDARRKSYSDEKEELSSPKDVSSKVAFRLPPRKSGIDSPSSSSARRPKAVSSTRFQVGAVAATQSPDRMRSRGLTQTSTPSNTSDWQQGAENQMNSLQVPSADSSAASTDMPRARRSARHLPKTYATHRRRTWSHLLEKK